MLQCWALLPEDRPTFAEILARLEDLLEKPSYQASGFSARLYEGKLTITWWKRSAMSNLLHAQLNNCC